jgi:hypothetical protein
MAYKKMDDRDAVLHYDVQLVATDSLTPAAYNPREAAEVISGDFPDDSNQMELMNNSDLVYGDFRLAADVMGIPYEGIDGVVHPIVPLQFLYEDDEAPMDDAELDAALRELQPVATEPALREEGRK